MTKVWDAESHVGREPPGWSLTGHMLLWSDGSPAHVRQEPFIARGAGWEAVCRVSRSAPGADRWLTLILRLDADVRAEWDRAGTSQRARALQALATYLRLREWYADELGVLELK